MSAFASLPVPAQNTVCFFALALCFAAIADGVLLLRQRRRGLACLTAAGFACAYLAMHLCRSLTELRLRGEAVPLALRFGRLPWLLPVSALALLGLLLALVYRSVRVWRRSHISAASIKESLDGLPAGICCYLEEGRCVLVNHRMNDICRMLLGRSLQNGAALAEAAMAQPIRRLSDGTTVAFRSRALDCGGQTLRELIADDVTELCARTERLRRDNARAEGLRAATQAYGETIADTVRRREILQAKIDIHDQMNRMLLATQRALRAGAEERERLEIARLWQNQITLLGSAGEKRPGSSLVSDLNALAAVIGLELVWDGAPEGDERTLSLLLRAVREAMTNAAKHARASRVFITLRSDGTMLEAVFTNDGAPCAGEIVASGGLALLRQSLEKAGGSMKIETAGGFRLSVLIPEGGEDHAVPGPDR